MMKHSFSLLVAFATTALAGCQLYFGENDNDGSWNYCGADGYYECQGDDCYWRGAECPTGAGQGSAGGFECNDNSDCAAGCYCGDGICEEAGFCTTDEDCGRGFVCNEQRSSCEPGTPEPTCEIDADCPAGQYCDAATGLCAASCSCVTDAEAKNGGFDFCDEERQTCMVGTDPDGDCAGPVTCNLGKPTCPVQHTPVIADGCWTGECVVIGSCGTAPACENLSHESDCLAGNDCSVSYTGINCTTPNNTPCQAGSTNCTCEEYRFSSCNSSGAMPRTTVEYNGYIFEVSELTLRN
jgi:hypothetical protein